MTAMRVIQNSVLATVAIPGPEQIADDVMALHTILELLIDQHFRAEGLRGVNATVASEVLPVLKHVSEQARRAACNIDHLAREC